MDKIQIKHFNGLESIWNNKISSGEYNHSIVFAKLYAVDPTSGSAYVKDRVIYAGKDVNGEEYKYSIGNDHDFEERIKAIENDVSTLNSMLAVDASGMFTSPLMLNGINLVINNLYNNVGDLDVSTNNAIRDIKDSIVWVYVNND